MWHVDTTTMLPSQVCFITLSMELHFLLQGSTDVAICFFNAVKANSCGTLGYEYLELEGNLRAIAHLIFYFNLQILELQARSRYTAVI